MSKFNCCNRELDYSLLKRVVAKGDGSPLQRFCKDCVSGTTPAVPDVYFGKEYINGAVNYEENIADPKTGKPIPFYDRQSKAAAMKMAGVEEAGDRKHGARNESHLHRKTYFS